MNDQNGNNNVRVNMAQIIDQIHTRYSRQIGALVQENAELAAAQEVILAENAEMDSKLKALMSAE